MTTNQTNDAPEVASHDLFCIEAGEIIQRGDLFRTDDGRYLEMDNLGRLLGLQCLGQRLKKSGEWFRKQNVNVLAPAGEKTPTKP